AGNGVAAFVDARRTSGHYQSRRGSGEGSCAAAPVGNAVNTRPRCGREKGREEVNRMPGFTFTGTDAQGKRISGERLADNKSAMTMQLRRERITPGAIKEKGKEFVLPTFGTGKVPTKELAVFFRQFSVMIDAGLPLVQCLEILAGNQENQVFQKCLTGVRTTVEGGSTLSNAMRQYPKIFDDLTTNMIEAGEAGGILDTILQRLATYLEKNVKLKSAVKSALIYPTAVISIAALVIGLLLKF